MDAGDGEDEDPLKSHADRAVVEYLRGQPFYVDLADVVGRIAKQSLDSRGIKVHSVQSRAKDPSSFGRKASTPLEEAPSTPPGPAQTDHRFGRCPYHYTFLEYRGRCGRDAGRRVRHR